MNRNVSILLHLSWIEKGIDFILIEISIILLMKCATSVIKFFQNTFNRKWQDYVYIQCEYKSTKQKIKHLLREENKVKENKIS